MYFPGQILCLYSQRHLLLFFFLSVSHRLTTHKPLSPHPVHRKLSLTLFVTAAALCPLRCPDFTVAGSLVCAPPASSQPSAQSKPFPLHSTNLHLRGHRDLHTLKPSFSSLLLSAPLLSCPIGLETLSFLRSLHCNLSLPVTSHLFETQSCIT